MQRKNARPSEEVLVAVGSNVGSGALLPISIPRIAGEALSESGYAPLDVSRAYRTPAWPRGAGPDFVNAAFRLPDRGTPEGLLDVLHRLEQRFGRVRGARWQPRTLDLDLIAWGQRVLPDAAVQTRWRAMPLERQRDAAPDRLILPHPRLQDRAFVLVPLADIAPDWVHPLTGLSVRGMLADLPEAEKSEIVPL